MAPAPDPDPAALRHLAARPGWDGPTVRVPPVPPLPLLTRGQRWRAEQAFRRLS